AVARVTPLVGGEQPVAERHLHLAPRPLLRGRAPTRFTRRPLAIVVHRMLLPPAPQDKSSSLHAHDLTQRVDDLDEVALRRHHRVDRLVRARRLVQHGVVLAALDALRRGRVVRERERPARLVARHPAPGAVAAAVEALRIALAAHDVGARTHAARNDAELARARADRTLARHEHVLAIVVLARDVIVVAVHGLHCGPEWRDPLATLHGPDHRAHHQLA